MKNTIRDNINRNWLAIKSWFRWLFNVTKKGNFLIPDEYDEVFSEDFKYGYSTKWDNGAEFGIPPYHPANPKEWYDPEQIKKVDDGISLASVVNPKFFPEINTTIPNAVGYLRTKDAWKYGIFSFQAKHPKGKWLWPALWLSGRYTWPPEIDVVESWSEDTENFDKNKHITTNVHYGRNGQHKMYNSYKHRLPNSVTDEFLEYNLWWEKDFIKIYYNGYLVLHVTNKTILDDMFESQRVIINNAIEESFNEDNITPFIVKSVKIYQK